MTKTLISLDDQQIQRIEQIIMDQDEPGALRYIEDLRKMIKRGQIGCNPLEFKTREGVDEVIDRARKNQ
ncbi:MAG: hypothetical protein NTY79_08810 [Chloroflexi bacterium]|nr:hypothetical protein [Chloroflexota bacterium]